MRTGLIARAFNARRLGRHLALCATLLTAGCLWVPYPVDLELVSLTVVNRRSDPQIPGSERGEDAVVYPYLGIQGGPLPPPLDQDEPFLKATFRSRFDFSQRTERVMISATARFCDPADRPPSFTGRLPPLMAWGSIFAGSRRVSDAIYPDEREAPLRRDADGQVIYHTYLVSSARPETNVNYLPEQRFDLAADPRDVCLSVRGHDYVPFQSSNTIRVPAATIRSAFQQR